MNETQPPLTITITEALAEIRTIEKRIAKKQEAIHNVLYRQEAFKDPLAREGGSVSFIAKERQGIDDLEKRYVDLRAAINAANNSTELTVGGRTMSVSEWLTWRKEIAPRRQQFLLSLRAKLQDMRQQAQRKGVAVTSVEAAHDTDIVVNINEAELANEIEDMETILGELDGRLSLVNARVQIAVG